MKQFKPTNLPKKFKIKYKHSFDWNFIIRNNHNLPFIIRTFSKLHYLGSHSFHQHKWHKIEQQFLKHYQRSSEQF